MLLFVFCNIAALLPLIRVPFFVHTSLKNEYDTMIVESVLVTLELGKVEMNFVQPLVVQRLSFSIFFIIAIFKNATRK